MSPELTSLLNQLSSSPAGLELTDIIMKGQPVSVYHPGKKDSSEQVDAWKYYSGCRYERTRILQILLLKELL